MRGIKNLLGNIILTVAAMPLCLLLSTKRMQRCALKKDGGRMNANSRYTVLNVDIVKEQGRVAWPRVWLFEVIQLAPDVRGRGIRYEFERYQPPEVPQSRGRQETLAERR